MFSYLYYKYRPLTCIVSLLLYSYIVEPMLLSYVLDSLVLSALFCVQCELYLACNCPRFVYLECRISRLVCQGAVFQYIMSKLCLSCFKMVVCAQGALSRMSKINAYWTKVHLKGLGFMFFLALRSIHTVLLRLDLTCSETIRIHATFSRH